MALLSVALHVQNVYMLELLTGPDSHQGSPHSVISYKPSLKHEREI